MSREYFVYIMASTSGVLYLGVTNNLQRRIYEHQQGKIPGFSSKYHCKRLIYFESYQDVRLAIAREKQLKNWNRLKKEKLIATLNPEWQDLSLDW